MKIEWGNAGENLLCFFLLLSIFSTRIFFSPLLPLKEKYEFLLFHRDRHRMHTCASEWSSARFLAKAAKLIYVNFNEVRSHDTHLKCWMIVAVLGEKSTFQHLLVVVIHKCRLAMGKQHGNRSYCDKKPRYSNRPTNDHICHTFFYELIVTLLTARHLTQFAGRDSL